MKLVVRLLCPLCMVFLAFVAVSPALAIDCDTIPPRQPIAFDSLRVFQFAGGANCWGWKAPDGTQYAIMGSGQGVGFVNVATMTVCDVVDANSCSWRELKTYRNYCYVVSECLGDKQGMMIIDMSYLPDSVHYVGSFTYLSNARAHCISIDTAKGFCYLVRQLYTGFNIFSLVNPEAPVFVGSVSTGDLHDMTAFNDTVYAAEGYNSAFSIWDCTNKAAPVMLGRVVIPGGGYVHNLWPTADRRFLASTEELPDFRTMKFWNIENLSNIFMVGEYLGPGGIPHNAHIEGNYIYLSHYSSGVSVLDISVPECLEEVKQFDTYLPNNSPIFDGCWGVYPHTDNSGLVYASNIDGRLFIFHTNVITADFTASPRVGDAPLTVDFADLSPGEPTAWEWDFGDGGTSTVENPSHVFGPGNWDITLHVTTPTGGGHQIRQDYITVLAETLKVTDTTLEPNTSMYWEINYENHVPIKEFRLPVDLSNSPEIATFDSISAVGCRTSYFEQKLYGFDNRFNGQASYKLKADHGGGSPPLPPGNGPIARVYFTLLPNAQNGQQVVFSMPPMGSGGSQTLNVIATNTAFVPGLEGATLTVVGGCSCPCHGDPVCDSLIDLLDVSNTLDVALRGGTNVVDNGCPHSGRTDFDCSGFTDLVDVTTIINVALRGGDPQTMICDPCAP